MHDDPSQERRERIAGRLAEGRTVAAMALAGEFGVSADAIRRDLRMLAAEGRCRRVYGGALPVSPASASMAERIGEDVARKRALARAAVELIRPDRLLFLDNGSTNLELARLLPPLAAGVGTNSVPIAAVLAGRPDLQLLLTGGVVTPALAGCVDGAASDAVARMSIDCCVLGACAVSAEEGLAAFDPADAWFKRVLVARSRTVMALVGNAKLQTRAPHRVMALEALDAMVVEHDAAAQEGYAALAGLGVPIVTAGPPA